MLVIIGSGRLAEISWSVGISKFRRSLCVSFCRTDGLCIYFLFVWSNLNFLLNSLLITLPPPPQSCLVLYFFYANLLHSLIMWFMDSSTSPHNLHLLFCCALSILALIWLVLMPLFCAFIRRGSVSLLIFPFLSHIHVFSCEISLVSRLKRPGSCFSCHFCFLFISDLLVLVLSELFLVFVISLLPRFSMLSSSCYIDASTLTSMLVSPLPPSFLDAYICQGHLWGVRPYVWSLVFLFSGPFV